MWAPQPFFQNATILLATQQSFCASYLAQALSMFGLRTVGPFASEAELHAWADAFAQPPAAIVLGADWLRDRQSPLPPSLMECNIPYLLVENAPWQSPDAGLQPAFVWPYAAFQIVEALQDAVARSMGLLDGAPVPPQPGHAPA